MLVLEGAERWGRGWRRWGRRDRDFGGVEQEWGDPGVERGVQDGNDGMRNESTVRETSRKKGFFLFLF